MRCARKIKLCVGKDGETMRKRSFLLVMMIFIVSLFAACTKQEEISSDSGNMANPTAGLTEAVIPTLSPTPTNVPSPTPTNMSSPTPNVEQSLNTDTDVFEYDFGSDGKIVIVSLKDKGVSSVNVPEKIYGIDVTEIADHAFVGCNMITSIELPDSLTSIGTFAFAGCSGLTSLKIPSGVTYIGGAAFSGCSSLISIELPDSLESIENYLFQNCSSLTSIKIPSGVSQIRGDGIFVGCVSLSSVEIPYSVKAIQWNVFSDCKNIEKVIVPHASSAEKWALSNGYKIEYNEAVVESKEIHVMSYTDELPNIVQLYLDMHPELGYTMKSTIIAITDDSYQPKLYEMLQMGEEQAPDIFGLDEELILEYTQGDVAKFLASYDELGIEFDKLKEESGTALYALQLGNRMSDKQVVALPYQSTSGCFIYRRSIAKDVWGTDDPVVVQTKIGGGTGNWDQFMNAAAELKENGYGIVSGMYDIWHAVENSAERGWVIDGKLYIDPKREEMLDLAKSLMDNDYSNATREWHDEWFYDIKGEGEKAIFGFFGPAWLVNYTMTDNSGSILENWWTGEKIEPIGGTYGDWAVCNSPVGFWLSGTWVAANAEVVDKEKKEIVADILQWITLDYDEDSFQYMLANGEFYDNGKKDTVVSSVVMEKSNGTIEFLAGQNMFDYYIMANQQAKGNNATRYDETINAIWLEAVEAYMYGMTDRNGAIDGFKQRVSQECSIIVPSSMAAPTELPTPTARTIYEGTTVEPAKAKVGDVVLFGSYEQDNIASNGAEAIPWYVLDKDEDKLLLMSVYLLDYVPYQEDYEAITWEDCTLRQWMNDEFYNRAFTESEKKHIQTSYLENADNSYYGTAGGDNTEDKVFALSLEEAEQYLGVAEDSGFYWISASPTLSTAKVTAYAEACGVWVYGNGNGCWWLRSPGGNIEQAAYVGYERGLVNVGGENVGYRSKTARPVLWLDLNP